MERCGQRIPASEHAVSMSLPSMRDVIGYEEQECRVLEHICSGYPRFVCHWMVQRVQARLAEQIGACVVALRDAAAVTQLRSRCPAVVPVEGFSFGVVRLPDGADSPAILFVQRFLQHTGLGLSSRQAEDILIGWGELSARQEEALDERPHPAGVVRGLLADAYGVAEGQIQLHPSGMSAFYSVFDAWNRQQAPQGRTVWLQVGSSGLRIHANESRGLGGLSGRGLRVPRRIDPRARNDTAAG